MERNEVCFSELLESDYKQGKGVLNINPSMDDSFIASAVRKSIGRSGGNGFMVVSSSQWSDKELIEHSYLLESTMSISEEQSKNHVARLDAYQQSLIKAEKVLKRNGHNGDSETMKDIRVMLETFK